MCYAFLMPHRFTLVGFGEALFDMLPEGEKLGGAPLNVAAHAHQLAHARGGRGVIVSRVGQDDLGQRVYDELHQRGMTTDFLQSDPDRPTGTVMVELSGDEVSYDIIEGVAWDVIQYDPDLEDLALHCDAVCYGTLAQRDAQSRNSLYRFLDTAKRAFKLYDVNLRPPYFEAGWVKRSCEYATGIKLNESELPQVAEMVGVYEEDHDARVSALLKKFDLKLMVLTRGSRGTALITPDGNTVEGDMPAFAPGENADPVGAGDSVSAAVLLGRVLRWPPERTANVANHVGAFVAGQHGPTPTLPDHILDMVK